MKYAGPDMNLKISKDKRCKEGIGCSWCKTGAQLRTVGDNPPEPFMRFYEEDREYGDGGISIAYKCKLCGDVVWASQGP